MQRATAKYSKIAWVGAAKKKTIVVKVTTCHKVYCPWKKVFPRPVVIGTVKAAAGPWKSTTRRNE